MNTISLKLKIAAIMLLTNNFLMAQKNMPDNTPVVSSSLSAELPANITGTILINSLKTIEPLVPVGTDVELNYLAPQYTNCRVKTDYFDCQGRELQTVLKAATSDKKDVVQYFTYDAFGRQKNAILPFVKATNAGGFCKNVQTELLNTYSNLGYADEQFLYKRNTFESSPLNVLVKSYSEGNNWSGNNKGVSFNKRANLNNDIIKGWAISSTTNLPVTLYNYANNNIWINTKTDEDELGNKEFYDLQGKLIMTMQINQSNLSSGLLTYYVYDELNRLRFVMPPKAIQLIEANSWNVSSIIVENLCFAYTYDDLGRITQVKTPGAGPVSYVYNNRDEVVFIQNAVQKSEDKWQFNKYDIGGRLIQTGIFSSNSNQAILQNFANVSSFSDIFMEYIFKKEIMEQTDIVNTFTNALVYLTNYYDNYSFTSITFDQTNAALVVGYNKQQTLNSNGLLTGVKALVSDNFSNPNSINYNIKVDFYNNRSELIQQYKEYFGTHTSRTFFGYDFSGRKVSSLMKQSSFSIFKKFAYDNFNRLLNVQHKINSATVYTRIASYSYDKLGRLNLKRLGSMQYPLNYEYNIRGWLTGINKTYCTDKRGDHFFGMEISYEKGFEKNYLNGRVAGIKWRNKGTANEQRTYGYEYDFAGRLTMGDYYQKTDNTGASNPTWSKLIKDYSASNISYDENGNILAMKHLGMKGNSIIILDDLSYLYGLNSNVLLSVTESTGSQSKDRTVHDNLADFRDVADGSDYTYDVNGSLTSDGNRGISSIDNNWFIINKPIKIQCGSGKMIEYTYDASGILLRKKITQIIAGTNKVTEYFYFDELTFKDSVLELISHEEGRYRPDVSVNYTGYEYYIKDYIGNIRSIIGEGKNIVTSYNGSGSTILADNGGGSGGGVNSGSGNMTSQSAISACDTCQVDFVDTNLVENPTVYLATSEVSNNTLENEIFDNITETRDLKPMSTDSSDVKDARLNAGQGKVIGPGLLLKVSAGDKIALGAEAFYFSNTPPGNPVSINSLVSSIISSMSGVAASVEGGLVQNISNINVAGLTSSLTQLQNNAGDTTGPRGYLNYIIFDENMNFLPQASGAIKVNQANAWSDLTVNRFNVPLNGYLYVFTSNLSAISIRTDNLYIIHWQGQLLEELHYYPYGLCFEPYRASNILKSSNYKHNSQHMEQNEFNDGTNDFGLDWYDFEARSYDVQIGRFMQVDPMAKERGWLNPYNYCQDNPVNITDPTGALDDDIVAKKDGRIEITETDDNFDRIFVENNNCETELVGQFDKNTDNLIQLPATFCFTSSDGISFGWTSHTIDSKRNISGAVAGALIGALYERGITDVSIGQFSLADGKSPAPSTSHKLGRNGDLRPLRSDGLNAPTTVSDENFDVVRNMGLVSALYKYGWKDIISEKNNSGFILPFTSSAKDRKIASDHTNHFHLQGFNPTIIIK
ncbi:MAG: hypothetical protein H7296_02550 [Bacteroidia bacterium]|nr:hypothetical protein [Bacteroidia bacterium]